MTDNPTQTDSPPAVSATDPDWSREHPDRFWDSGAKLLRAIRGYQRWRGRGLFGRLIAIRWTISYRFWTIISGADIPITLKIAGGLRLPHPNGIVIHPQAQIGPNCLIFHQVTLGVLNRGSDVPRIGGHVDIGAGAKLLGPITIGDNAMIGANAVVLRDVPDGATAVGIPARLVDGAPVGEHR